jgi:hypothetical protein
MAYYSQKVILPKSGKNGGKFCLIFFTYDLSEQLAALGRGFSSDDDLCCVLSGDSQRIKVLCITMGLCITYRYILRFPLGDSRVAMCHA